MNTACQLNYVISVAYGYVEYKKNKKILKLNNRMI